MMNNPKTELDYVDYGAEGHKKAPACLTNDEAFLKIQEFKLKPTLIIHTGGGFHFYWVSSIPIEVSSYGIEPIEATYESLSLELGGHAGTQYQANEQSTPCKISADVPELDEDEYALWQNEADKKEMETGANSEKCGDR